MIEPMLYFVNELEDENLREGLVHENQLDFQIYETHILITKKNSINIWIHL